MARYRGPRTRVIRRLQRQLPGLTRRTGERRPYPPGEHGKKRQRRPSEYRVRLDEKQRLRFHYGVSETQLRRYFARAASRKGDTGLLLIQALERRLDNIVFRAGFAPTIPAARQLVSHGHIAVGGRRVTVPGYAVDVGDVVSVRPRSRELGVIRETIEHPPLAPAAYLSVDTEALTARMEQLPSRDDAPFDLRIQLVIELYSR